MSAISGLDQLAALMSSQHRPGALSALTCTHAAPPFFCTGYLSPAAYLIRCTVCAILYKTEAAQLVWAYRASGIIKLTLQSATLWLTSLPAALHDRQQQGLTQPGMILKLPGTYLKQAGSTRS